MARLQGPRAHARGVVQRRHERPDLVARLHGEAGRPVPGVDLGPVVAHLGRHRPHASELLHT